MMSDKKLISTGTKGLDELLNGGLPEGRTILISGSSGTGKTTFTMQFAYHGAMTGEPALFITLEESKEKILDDMKGIGMDITKAPNLHIVGGSIADLLYVSQKSGAKINDFLREIKDMIEETGAKRVVIDSVNLFLILFDTDEERRRALIALSKVLNELDCTALLTSEVRENSFDLSWYGFEEFVVDGVITLYNSREKSSFLQGITVRKMRGVHHKKIIAPYRITSKGLIVYPDQPFIS